MALVDDHLQPNDERTTADADWREILTVVLLSITTIATAWVGFQASKWSGAMAISFSQASTARIDASRLESIADRKFTVQTTLFAEWVSAAGSGQDDLANFVEARFPEPLATAFDAWIAQDPLQNPDAPLSPFAMPEYVIPEVAATEAADERADALYEEALEDNQRGDNYTAMTIAYAAVLFFTAMSSRINSVRLRTIMLAMAALLFVAASILLITYPRLV